MNINGGAWWMGVCDGSGVIVGGMGVGVEKREIMIWSLRFIESLTFTVLTAVAVIVAVGVGVSVPTVGSSVPTAKDSERVIFSCMIPGVRVGHAHEAEQTDIAMFTQLFPHLPGTQQPGSVWQTQERQSRLLQGEDVKFVSQQLIPDVAVGVGVMVGVRVIVRVDVGGTVMLSETLILSENTIPTVFRGVGVAAGVFVGGTVMVPVGAMIVISSESVMLSSSNTSGVPVSVGAEVTVRVGVLVFVGLRLGDGVLVCVGVRDGVSVIVTVGVIVSNEMTSDSPTLSELENGVAVGV